MNFFLALTLTLTTAVSFAGEKPMSESYKIDPVATKVVWTGKKITGQHSGNISVKEGTLVFSNDIISSGVAVVDMKTITNTDIPMDTKENIETNGKLVGHLSSPDFFDVAKYPESKLVINSSVKTDKGLLVKGELTMIGNTKPIEFLMTVTKTATEVTAKSNIVIDRTKWNLKYGSGSFFKGLGDKAINNEFALSIDLTAKK